MSVTLDASVWLAGLIPDEPAHAPSRDVIRRIVTSALACAQPTLFLVEVCAATARRSRDPRLAFEAGQVIRDFPRMEHAPLDAALAAEAAGIAAECGLRGADAVYVATARRAGSTLVTLDRELRECASGVVRVETPDEWLQRQP